MSKQKKLKEVVDFCWSHSFLDVFHAFFDEHSAAFEGAPTYIENGEHNLEYYSLFQKYLRLYEVVLSPFNHQTLFFLILLMQ